MSYEPRMTMVQWANYISEEYRKRRRELDAQGIVKGPTEAIVETYDAILQARADDAAAGTDTYPQETDE